MQDIRLVDSDGEYLNLETQGGEKFRLVLDDSLRSAIRRETQVNLDSVSISPREIQDFVRSGISAEDVASKHTVSLEYVEKFALTVVDEIGHIIASAQTVRISIEADRYSEASQVEFGEVLEGRLRKAEASNIAWSATKQEASPWMVSVSFDSPQGASSAIWSFDQRKLVLSPENDAAVRLSAGDFNANTTSPKLRQVDSDSDVTRIIDIPRIEISASDVGADETLSIAGATVSSIEELTRSSLQAVTDEVETLPTEPTQPVESAGVLSPTGDLLEALRKKRAEATAPSVQVEPKTAEAPHEDVIEGVEETSPAAVSPAAKKGRPSMPSWDEIVFGTKADD